jgi:hypothetical protein
MSVYFIRDTSKIGFRRHCYILLSAIANFNVLVVQMDELACFAPGMLTLGTEGASPEKAKEYLDLAEEVNT